MQFLNLVLYILLAVTSIFLICLVLIQRGKGGGLAGAFGGAGGSSAFGTKAGDVFTRVTMITAAIWISQAMLLVVLSNHRPSVWPNTPSPRSDFTPAKPTADKAAAPGEGTEKGTALPIPSPKGSPAAPVPLPDAPPASK